MNRLAIIDLDGVVADNTEREARSRQFADSRFVREPGIIPSVVYADAWKKIFYSERALYNPEWIALDTLIEGAKEDLETLRYKRGYAVLFLTSRPEHLRAATTAWLHSHNIMFFASDGVPFLIMKPPAFQYTKTVTWKVGMIQTLFTLYEPSEMIVVEDEEGIHAELKKWIASPQYLGFTSLKEVLEN